MIPEQKKALRETMRLLIQEKRAAALHSDKLARIFHASHSEAQTKNDESRRRKDFDQGCMSTYCSDQNSTTTHYSSALGKPQTERDEIFGLADLLKNIYALPEWKKASTVLLYAPLPHEPDLLKMLEENASRRFLFPRMHGSELCLYQWAPEASWSVGPYGISEPDTESWPQIPLAEVDLALIPGLAFDAQGGRLGWGGGFYDRLLTRTFPASQSVACPKPMNTVLSSNFDQGGMCSYSPDQNPSDALSHQLLSAPRCERHEISGLSDPTCRAYKAGIAWPWQLVPTIPRENFDVLMDAVVTPFEIYRRETTNVIN